jgi:hypothetical protein
MKELTLILNKVDEILNESKNDSFLLGFKFGLNEGFKNWLSNTTNTIVDTSKNLYNKGKELAFKFWDIVKKTLDSSINKMYDIANSVIDNYSSSMETILGLANKLVDDMSNHMRETTKEVYNDIIVELSNKTINALNIIWDKIPVPELTKVLDTINVAVSHMDIGLDLDRWLTNKKVEAEKKIAEFEADTDHPERTYVSPNKYRTYNRGVANRWNTKNIQDRHFENKLLLTFEQFTNKK